MYAFNDTVDRAFLKPIATGYDTLMPDPAQNCVHNIFNNLGDAWSAINSFLQGRGHDFFNTLGRVLFNSTMGLGGCIDVARSEEHTSELQSLMSISYAVFCLKKKNNKIQKNN